MTTKPRPQLPDEYVIRNRENGRVIERGNDYGALVPVQGSADYCAEMLAMYRRQAPDWAKRLEIVQAMPEVPSGE